MNAECDYKCSAPAVVSVWDDDYDYLKRGHMGIYYWNTMHLCDKHATEHGTTLSLERIMQLHDEYLTRLIEN